MSLRLGEGVLTRVDAVEDIEDGTGGFANRCAFIGAGDLNDSSNDPSDMSGIVVLGSSSKLVTPSVPLIVTMSEVVAEVQAVRNQLKADRFQKGRIKINDKLRCYNKIHVSYVDRTVTKKVSFGVVPSNGS